MKKTRAVKQSIFLDVYAARTKILMSCMLIYVLNFTPESLPLCGTRNSCLKKQAFIMIKARLRSKLAHFGDTRMSVVLHLSEYNNVYNMQHTNNVDHTGV
jgi:hypothetical protein